MISYCVISISIVYFNWWLFSREFRFPVFVSWLQQVFGVFCFVSVGLLGKAFPALRCFRSTWWRWPIVKKVLPLSVTFVGTVALSNVCLKFVQVSTYQVARGLTLVFTATLSYFILGELQHFATILACAVVMMGFFTGSLDPSTLSLTAAFAGGFSSMFQALYNVAVKNALPCVHNDANLLLYYNLSLSAFIFLPVIYLVGESSVWSELQWNPAAPNFFSQWGSLALSGILSTLINVSSYWCIRCTSPLTYNIVGITKSVVQSAGGIVFLGDTITPRSILSITLTLLGSSWYSLTKLQSSAKSAGDFTGRTTCDLEMGAREETASSEKPREGG